MNWLKNLFRPKQKPFLSTFDIGLLDIRDKIVVMTIKSSWSWEEEADAVKKLGQLVMDKGGLGMIVVDENYNLQAQDIETFESVLTKAKEKLSANPNS